VMPPLPGPLNKPSYSVIRSLGGGAVGQAWLMRNEVLGERFVSKRYDTLGIPDAVARREPQLLRELNHPHVAEVLDATFGPGEYEITFHMPYYEGGSIADALGDGYAFSIEQAITLAVHALDALAYLHNDRGYIHRDAKPGNIFLDGSRRRAYLGDFGSVGEMGTGGRVSAIHGTPLYTPPEGGPVDGEMGVTGDIYAVAMTLYEMVNGAFDYAALSPAEVDRRLGLGQRALVDSAFERWDPYVPNDIRRIIRKGMRRDPAERHQSCSRFIQALAAVKSIDWKRHDGGGLDGEWIGTWPPQDAADRRRRYRVTSRVLRTGTRRIEAYEARSTGGWRRFGVPDATLSDPADRRGVERFFADVAARAAHLVAAR
jgi:eukaryotic-like serine/threonine-protein kinase